MATLHAQQSVNTQTLADLEKVTGDLPPDGNGDGTTLHGPSEIDYKFGDTVINMPGTYVFAAGQVISGPISEIDVLKGGDAAYQITGIGFEINNLWNDALDNGKLDTVPDNLFNGADTMTGSAFADTLFSFDLNDTVNGAGGDDHINGGDGDDTLLGGTGNDRIEGGDANDTITGGTGADRLSGDAGADTFLFLALTDSTKKGSGRDTILDFSHKEGDIIDLSAIDANSKKIGDQDFDFVGKHAFKGHRGELHYKVKGGDHILIQGDVNGDAKADFSITVDVHKLHVHDFHL